MNMYKPPIPASAGNIGMGGGASNQGMRPDYKNISSVPPTSGVAALLHHSQGSQFQTMHEDDRQKRIFIREKERERRRLGLSAPDNYGGSKDKLGSFSNRGGPAGKPGNESFSLSRNQEKMNFQMPQKFDQPQYMPQQPQMPSVPIYNPQQMNPQVQTQFFEPQQIPQFQQYGQMPSQQSPFYPQMPSQAFPQQQQFMHPYGMPQPSYSPPPLGGFLPYQMPGQYSQYQQTQPPPPQQVQLNIPNISPQGRAGGQPRQGGVGINPNRSPSQQPLYIPENPGTVQRETFFDKFGQPDSVATNLNGGSLTQQDKARKLREELEQQIQEKKKRQEEEKIEKEKWEQKYGEASYNAQQAKQQNAAPNEQTAGNPFAGTQQYPLQNQATFQGNPPAQQQNNLNSSFNNGQPRQLPGGGTQVAHGAVPQESTSSPNRNHPSQVDAYKNELMIQIEEKRKIKELERKKKLEEDEREEQRVRKEMEEMQRRYQYEANPDAAPPFGGQQNDQQQQNDPINNRSVDQSQRNKGYNNEQINGGNRQFNNNNYDDMGGSIGNGGDPNENFDSYQDQSVNGNFRGGQQQQQQNQNYSYQHNNNSYQSQRLNKQQSRKIHVHHPQINWNEDPNVGPDSTPQAFESQFFVPDKEDDQSQAQNSQNYNNYPQNNNNYQQRNRTDSFDNQGLPQQQQPRPNPEQHRQQYIKQTKNQGAPSQNEFQQNQFQQQPDNFNNYPNNEFNQQAPFFGAPQLNVPQPPPPPNLMADFDPFKQKLQQQLSTFQKDILRMQHQQKSMMKNYHKEIEMLQVKKQQIINDMKSDQDIQMKMQIQQLSTAIAQLSMKMSNKEPPYQRRHSYSPPPPNKSEIVAEVIQELKNVLQPLQYTQAQYSQSQSPPQHFNQYPISEPPPQYQQINTPAFVPQQLPQYQSELPYQLQNKKITKSRSPKNSQYMPHQQYQNQNRQQTNEEPVFRQQQIPQPQQDMQLPSTTMMMPHTDLSPVHPPIYNQPLRQSLVSSLITEDEPLRTNIQLAHQTELIPHNSSLILQQQPLNPPSIVENKPKMDINITLPYETQSQKGSLIQKAKQIHHQNVIEQEERKINDDPMMNQKRRKSIMQEVNIGLPHDQIGAHTSILLEKAKEIHDHPDIPLLIEHGQSSNKQMSKRRGSAVMQMPMMEVLKEEVEQEGILDSDRIKTREPTEYLHLADRDQLHIPSNSLLDGGISPRRRVVAEVNIAIPAEIKSHRSQLLEKAQQIHNNVLPAIPPQGFDRSSLTTSQDKRRKPAAMLDYNRQSSQLSKNPIMEALDEEEQESQKSLKQLSHRSSIKLKKEISSQPIKVANIKSVSPQIPQPETPREEREKLLERIRQKNKEREQEEQESRLNNAFVSVETPQPQVAMKIDQQKRLSRSNSEINTKEQQQNRNNEVVAPPAIQPPLAINSRDIGTALPNKRRGISQMNQLPNSQVVQKSQIPRIPKVPSTIVQPDHFSLLEDARLDNQTKNQKQGLSNKSDLIDRREKDLPNNFIDQGADSISKNTVDANVESQTDKQSQVRSNKLNTQAFNEALDSIKQVQANLEARNIIGPNPIQRVNQRTKPTTLNEDQEFEEQLRLTSYIISNSALQEAQALLVNNHPSTITQNYSQEEFYGDIQQLDANTQELPLYSNQYPKYQVDQQQNQMMMQQPLYNPVNQGNISRSQYFQHIQDQGQTIPLNQDILSQQNYYIQNQNALMRQSFELQQQQIMSQYSPQQRQSIPSYQAQPFLQGEVPQIEIPNPDIVYQDGYGNFVNFVPEGLRINEYYKQDPAITSSFQAIQRNPYQAQYPLSQIRPQVVKPEFDYNEEFQHMAKEDSRLPTPIGTVNQQNSEATPQEVKSMLSGEEAKKPTPKIISAQRSPVKPADSSPPNRNGPLLVPEYSMIVSANLSEVKNTVFTTETTSENQALHPSTKRVVQPMQIPPWRQHLAPPQQYQQQQVPQQSPTRISPVKADENQVTYQQIKGYNTEDTVQYRIEQQQNVLEQELLYDQLMQYERQHLQEVQKYMIQQQAAREQLIEPYNQGVTESQEGLPKQITFPDFTGFLYNKFLVNGPPTTYTPYVDVSGPKTGNPQQNQEPSPRTKFVMQMSQNPSYTLVSRDPSMIAPEPSQPPSMMLSTLAATKPKPKPQNLDQMTDVVNATQLQIPHTPSHMMRPVTQAPPRRLEEEHSKQEEQKEFLMKIDQIQQIVGQYERIKKDVEYERMIQEQINNEQMSKEYMKNLKKVERLVNEKNHFMIRKGQDQESFNIVDNSSEDHLSPKNHRQMLAPPKIQSQAKSRAYTSQGNRQQPVQNLIKEVQPKEEDTMQDMSQTIQPTSSPQQKIEVPLSRSDQDKDKSLFSRQLSQQLNLADGSSLDETKFAKQMRNNNEEIAQPLELPEINSGRGQTTGVKFLRDMLKQVPSIPTNPYQSNSQSRNSKPPLPPIHGKTTSYQSSLPQMAPKSDLNQSSYIPRHILNSPGIILPPIRQASQHSSNREFENTSTINLGNDETQNYQMNSNLLQLKQLQRKSSSLSDLFQPLPQPKVEYKKEDPFSLRDRLKQTLQETGQILRNDNISLLQKVQEAGKSIKPSYYEQGLPPIIDLAQRDLVHLSQPGDYATKFQGFNMQEDPIMGNGQFSNYDIVISSYPPGQATSFSNNFQQWDAKRTVKNTDDRYNIVRSSGTSPVNNPYLNNELVKEIMQQRNMEQQLSQQNLMKRQNSIPKISLAPSPAQLNLVNSQIKEMRNSVQSLGSPQIVTLTQKPIQVVHKSSDSVKFDESMATINKVEQAFSGNSLIETKPLPQNFVQSPIQEHHSEYSHNGFSSNYDNGSRLGDISQEPIVYRVVEHIVESPKNIFGVSSTTNQVVEIPQQKPSEPNVPQQISPQEMSKNNNLQESTSSPLNPLNINGTTFGDAASKVQQQEEGERTRQNVQNDKNISLEEETANVWVSKWFSSAQVQNNTSSSLNQLTPQ